ncbi:MAG: hypothetical protein A2452_02930 [Candidatus Firestonebacteria bacterium RIFOXYC2_FULL_39_67]|nr:MAG: hypothetical protein A2536_02345 [Candidatus Firestonebacteria bacterium RIFOXYD2_FULL_39_29]OGF55410.1 MAG: hypothetical protein A2452_02930 [Candidatus Firestonebacteria bacterium RIFOXYC2_FULL_39_67]OGF57947.1 MAG: hypothetical protein A2497_06715 [Candidatus Firestonebacteria bacterium RifOxyC12_full_39_7]
MSNRTIILFLLLIVLMLAAAVHFTRLPSYITFEDFQNNSAFFKRYVADNYFLTVLFYIGIYFVVAAFSIPGAFVLTIAGGFLFGTVIATVYVLAGATAGAILAFLTSRYLLGNYIQKRYEKELLGFNKEINDNGKNYILMLRFISIPPFFLLNIIAGLTKIDLKTFIWTTALGILPATLIYSNAGNNLSRIEEPGDLLSIRLLAGFVLLGLLTVLPVLAKKFMRVKKAV